MGKKGQGTYHGTIANARIKQINWPRIIFTYLGARQVTSAANGTMLHAIEVPIVANANEADAKNTPARAFDVYEWSKIPFNKSYGFQNVSPHILCTAEVVMIPNAAQINCAMGKPSN